MSNNVSSESRPILDNWAGHMTTDLTNKGNAVFSTSADSRGPDVIRQMCGALCCSIFCFPCATTRLTRHYCTPFDPIRIECLDLDVPGLELCSTARCDCCEERGYGHNEYETPQEDGTGLSRRNLDHINIGCTCVDVVALIACVIISAS